MPLKVDLKLLSVVALATIGVMVTAVPKALAAQDWQCGVILCMANPAGAMAAGPDCQSDMNELTAWLSDPFHSWPVCAGIGDNASYSGGAMLLGIGRGGAEVGLIYEITVPGQKNPAIFIKTGTGYQYIPDFTGQIIKFRK